VRELEHALERAVLLSTGDTIGAGDLGHSEPRLERALASARRADPHAAEGSSAAGAPLGGSTTGFVPGIPLREALEGPERAIIAAALLHCGGNRKETARLLDVNRTTLFNKMKKYKLMESKSDLG
jgi:two-component system response regulator HydG